MNEVNVLLFQGTWIVSEIEEIEEAAYGMPDCILKYPCEIGGDVLVSWPPYTDEDEIPIRSSDISVIVGPSKKISELYKEYIEEKV